jgi:1-acyl-sn-glycerol-3-phosphate acyltransferase
MEKIRKFVGWFITVPFGVVFGLVMAFFHPLFAVEEFFPDHHRARFFRWLSSTVLWTLRIFLLAKVRIKTGPTLPSGRPLIVISNHQSTFDIPMIVLALPNHYARFVAKKELGKWLPSCSIILRHGCALIDRKDSRQAVTAIADLAERAEKNKYAVSIFPEGTRARDGRLKKFHIGGIASLLKHMPSALVVPMVVEGPWEIYKYGMKPIPAWPLVQLTVLEPIEPAGMTPQELTQMVQDRITAASAEQTALAASAEISKKVA